MLLCRSPSDAYRRIEFDARIAGASRDELVQVCFERFDAALGRALRAFERNDNAEKGAALAQALAALTALQLGLDDCHPIAGALEHIYKSARRTVLASVPHFDPDRISNCVGTSQKYAAL